MEKSDFKLKWMAWEITAKCNMSCVHCRSSSEAGLSHGKITYDSALKVLDNLKTFADPVIVLSGGEPLLRDDLFKIASEGSARGFRMAMATNGALVSGLTCEKIKDAGIQIVSMSLDGASASVHDNFRGQEGAFAAVMRAAEFFNKYAIKFIINSSFTKRNQNDIKGAYELAKKMGAHAWYMFLIVPTGRGEEIMNELVSKEDYEQILEWHYDMEREENALLVRPTCAPQYYRVWKANSKRDGESVERRSLSFSTGGGKGCVAAQSILFLSSDGEVYPCSYFPLSAGNVLRTNISEIWENAELFKNLRNFASYEGKCGVCKYLGVCGGCRARSYAVTGDYLAEEPFCEYIPSNYSAVRKG